MLAWGFASSCAVAARTPLSRPWDRRGSPGLIGSFRICRESSGLSLIRQLRAVTPQLRVLVSSSHDSGVLSFSGDDQAKRVRCQVETPTGRRIRPLNFSLRTGE